MPCQVDYQRVWEKKTVSWLFPRCLLWSMSVLQSSLSLIAQPSLTRMMMNELGGRTSLKSSQSACNRMRFACRSRNIYTAGHFWPHSSQEDHLRDWEKNNKFRVKGSQAPGRDSDRLKVMQPHQVRRRRWPLKLSFVWIKRKCYPRLKCACKECAVGFQLWATFRRTLERTLRVEFLEKIVLGQWEREVLCNVETSFSLLHCWSLVVLCERRPFVLISAINQQFNGNNYAVMSRDDQSIRFLCDGIGMMKQCDCGRQVYLCNQSCNKVVVLD